MLLDRLRKTHSQKRTEQVATLLPWYASGSLSPAERQAVETLLQHDAELVAELDFWNAVGGAVAEQEDSPPPSRVWHRVEAAVQGKERQRRGSLLPRLVLAMALTLAVLFPLWTILEPGIQLEWAVDGGPLTAFRVYRAPVGSAEFGLLGEVPAEPGLVRYTFVDVRVVPAQTYVYRLEAVGAGGQAAASRVITTDAWPALPSQLALVLVSLTAGCGAVVVAPRLLPARWDRLLA